MRDDIYHDPPPPMFDFELRKISRTYFEHSYEAINFYFKCGCALIWSWRTMSHDPTLCYTHRNPITIPQSEV